METSIKELLQIEENVLVETLMPFLEKRIRYAGIDYPYINSGGCGIFANILSNKLEALEIPHQIVLIYYGDPGLLKTTTPLTLKSL